MCPGSGLCRNWINSATIASADDRSQHWIARASSGRGCVEFKAFNPCSRAVSNEVSRVFLACLGAFQPQNPSGRDGARELHTPAISRGHAESPWIDDACNGGCEARAYVTAPRSWSRQPIEATMHEFDGRDPRSGSLRSRIGTSMGRSWMVSVRLYGSKQSFCSQRRGMGWIATSSSSDRPGQVRRLSFSTAQHR